MKRKLASIQRVKWIKPIDGADRIELIGILGWNVVVAKSYGLKVDDLVIFCEIDSLLPVIPELKFLSSQGTKKSFTNGKEYVGYQLKTIRLRKQVSQGLCLPLSILKGKKYPKDSRKKPVYDFEEGTDVTTLFGVVKWEPVLPANLAGQVKGFFPSFIPKTDEVRIQTEPKVLKRYKNEIFYVTEKVDGTSCTIFVKDGELNVCSRNLNLKEDKNNTYWKVARKLKLQGKLEKIALDIALQGELIGEGIQKNRLKIKGHKILFFDAYDMKEKKYLDFNEFVEICDKLKIQMVPFLKTNFKLLKTVDEMVKFATRKSIINDNAWIEGIVVRPIKEIKDRNLGRLSFKVANPEFLIKHNE